MLTNSRSYSEKEKRRNISTQKDDPILPSILLTIVLADWGTTEDVIRVMMSSSQIYKTLDWEYIFKCIVQRRGGLPQETKLQLREQTGSWKDLCVQFDKRTKARHVLRCIKCRGFPIDGPLYSCLHCYGGDWVMCSDCEKTCIKWHPESHVLIKWPKACNFPRLQAGRFCYQMLNWFPTKMYDGVIRHCSDCNSPLSDICVGCVDCCKEVCLFCGIGKRKFICDTKEGRDVFTRLQDLESCRRHNLFTGDNNSIHATHRRILYPPMTIIPKPQNHHCCCDVCGKIPLATEKRYRCALCYDYDRCETCQYNVECQSRMTHAHPMLVISYAAQRQHIDRVPIMTIDSRPADDDDNDSDFDDDDEEEEEEMEEDTSPSPP